MATYNADIVDCMTRRERWGRIVNSIDDDDAASVASQATLPCSIQSDHPPSQRNVSTVASKFTVAVRARCKLRDSAASSVNDVGRDASVYLTAHSLTLVNIWKVTESLEKSSLTLSRPVYRRIYGYRPLPQLASAYRDRDQQTLA